MKNTKVTLETLANKMDNGLAIMNKRIDGLEGFNNKFDTGLAGVNKRIDSLAVKVDGLSVSIETLDGNMGVLAKQMETGLTTVNEKMDVGFTRLDKKMDKEIESLAIMTANRFDELYNELKGLKHKVYA